MAGCSSCAKRRKTRGHTNSINVSNTTRIREQNIMQSNEFKLMYYIGKDGPVESMKENINYGIRNSGQRIMVHSEDIAEYPHLWSENKPVEKVEKAVEKQKND